jgi:hypothetical protein
LHFLHLASGKEKSLAETTLKVLDYDSRKCDSQSRQTFEKGFRSESFGGLFLCLLLLWLELVDGELTLPLFPLGSLDDIFRTSQEADPVDIPRTQH